MNDGILSYFLAMLQPPAELMRQPLSAVVLYLDERCTSTLDKVRAYFRWLCTRDSSDLIEPEPAVDHEEAVLKTLMNIANHNNASLNYSELFTEMCRYVKCEPAKH